MSNCKVTDRVLWWGGAVYHFVYRSLSSICCHALIGSLLFSLHRWNQVRAAEGHFPKCPLCSKHGGSRTLFVIYLLAARSWQVDCDRQLADPPRSKINLPVWTWKETCTVLIQLLGWISCSDFFWSASLLWVRRRPQGALIRVATCPVFTQTVRVLIHVPGFQPARNLAHSCSTVLWPIFVLC